MSNHRKLREAPSERPAEPDPSPSADRTGKALKGYLEVLSEVIRQGAEDEIESEMRKWEATHRLREARKIIASASDALAIAVVHFVGCGKPDQARACQKIADALWDQYIAISDLRRQLTEEEQ